MSKYKICPNCGRDVPVNAQFCDACGSSIGNATGNGKKKIIIPVILILLIVIAGAGFFFWNIKFKTLNVDLTSSINKENIDFSGEDGNGRASADEVVLRNNIISSLTKDREKEFMKKVRYEITPDSRLSNGDKITIKATYPAGAENEYHIKAENTERTITVSNLKERETAAKSEKKFDFYDSDLYNPEKNKTILHYDQRKLSDAEINSMDKDEAQRAINDIYANHDYKFTSKKWADYYEAIGKQGTIPSKYFSKDVFSRIEKYNYDRLTRHRDSL